VWLTLLSQLAVGISATAGDTLERSAAAAVAAIGVIGALFHLGRPIAAWKALRNLRRSWLSREVALLGAYTVLAITTAAIPVVAPLTVAVGCAGIYASARLYVVPGRPAWDTPLTIVRFFATALALGPALTGHRALAAAGIGIALLATVLNWWRLARQSGRAARGALRLELRWFRWWTAARWSLGAAAVAGAWGGVPLAVVFVVAAASELLGRWLFYVAVVPLNMPGAFWRGAPGSHP
jgi:DMSO reductase anchor subunit